MKYLNTATVTLLLCLFSTHLYAQDTYDLDENYSIGASATLHLSSDDADVTIKGSDREDVHLVVYRHTEVKGWKIKSDGEFRMEVEERGSDLYIRENSEESNRLIVGNVREEYRITLEVPQNVALDINGDDDSYEISDMNQDVRLDADDCDAEFRGMKGDDFDFDIDDGSIRMDEARGRLQLKMDDGNMYVRQGDFSEIEARYDDGELEIATGLVDDGFYRFDFDDGDLELRVASGGGTFDVEHDDVNLYTDKVFEEINSDEERSEYRLSGGNARVEIDTDDGTVSLRTI